ncbi:aldehyde dehydrogenase family protein [Halobaculum litoreum]|uniref:Aldehyde dehydrogenase family protein n=1 Tax=Halobaculum litoreum TaxID=3031998 RepID=A0ABD5XP76_9EURY|nr:aldehyde dehydrogenase family protein [Halobaculum sp. DT92]
MPAAGVDDVEAAVDRARAAQPGWADRSVGERAAVLDRVADLALDRRGALADAVQAETGKEREGAYQEVWGVAANADYYAERAPGLLGATRRRGRSRSPRARPNTVTPWAWSGW